MRVLHVIESMGPGGAERHLANLLAPLADLGVENLLVTFWPGRAYEAQVAPFVRRYELALPDRRVFPALPALVRLAQKADVVHTQLPWADIAGRLAAFAAQKPCVTTLQSTCYDRENMQKLPFPIRYKQEGIRLLDSLSARLTKRFFAVSEATRETYIKRLGVPGEKIEIIPNSVNLTEFDPTRFDRATTRAELGVAPEEALLLSVGRLVPSKRQEVSIQAAAEAARVFPLKLFLAGAGPEEERLREMASRLSAPVVFLGLRPDVPRLLAAADLFLFPTAYEGLPLSLIEAMAMGLPCLCTDIPENREVAGEAAIYAPLGEVSVWTERICALLKDNDLRSSLTTQARARVGRFDARLAAARLVRAFGEVLS